MSKKGNDFEKNRALFEEGMSGISDRFIKEAENPKAGKAGLLRRTSSGGVGKALIAAAALLVALVVVVMSVPVFNTMFRSTPPLPDGGNGKGYAGAQNERYDDDESNLPENNEPDDYDTRTDKSCYGTEYPCETTPVYPSIDPVPEYHYHEHEFIVSSQEGFPCQPLVIEKRCSICGYTEVQQNAPTAEHQYVGGVCVVCGEYAAISTVLIFNELPDGSGYSVYAKPYNGDLDYKNYGLLLGDKLQIPAEYKGKPVVAVEDGGFMGTSVREVTVEGNNLISIGAEAFMDCCALESVELPSSLKTIGDAAFALCSSLKKIYLPEGLTDTGYKTFSDCKSLLLAYVPGSVKTLKSAVFGFCPSLDTLILSEGIEIIDTAACMGCSSLHSVVIPSSVREIRGNAFADCPLETVEYVGDQTKILIDISAFSHSQSVSDSEEFDEMIKYLTKDSKTFTVGQTADYLGECFGEFEPVRRDFALWYRNGDWAKFCEELIFDVDDAGLRKISPPVDPSTPGIGYLIRIDTVYSRGRQYEIWSAVKNPGTDYKHSLQLNLLASMIGCTPEDILAADYDQTNINRDATVLKIVCTSGEYDAIVTNSSENIFDGAFNVTDLERVLEVIDLFNTDNTMNICEQSVDFPIPQTSAPEDTVIDVPVGEIETAEIVVIIN